MVGAWDLPLWRLGGWMTFGIFLLSGWSLDLGALKARRWGPSLAAAAAVNLLWGPALAWALLAWAQGRLPQELALGVAVMACTPTTLSTGLSLAVAGGGNLAMALVLTLCLVAASALTLPLQLPQLAPAAAAAGLEPGFLFRLLLGQVLLPLALGQALRLRLAPPQAARWLPSLGVAASIWLAVSRHPEGWPPLAWAGWALAAFALLRGGLHLAALAASAQLGLDKASRRSFVVVSSQKSVMLAGALLAQLPPGAASLAGGAALFCVAYHLSQALWDSALAPRA